jgi:hypothetical protein
MNTPNKNQRLVVRAGQGYRIVEPLGDYWDYPGSSSQTLSREELMDKINRHVCDLRFCHLEYVAPEGVRKDLPCEYIRAVA